jgi:hypothetical protein
MITYDQFTTDNTYFKPRTINLYFGEQHDQTLDRFTKLSKKLRRSRTQTLDFLLNYYDCREEDLKYMRVMG